MSTPPASNPVFNASDFATSSAGLTEAQANVLYPRMATESTSWAKQHFYGGIGANDISSSIVLNVGSETSSVNLVGGLQLNGVSGSANDVLTSNGLGQPPTFQPAQVVSTFPDGLTTASVNPISGNLYVGHTMASGTLSLGSSFAPTQVVGTLIAPTINSPAVGTSLIIGGEIVGPAKLYLGSLGQTVNARGGLLVAGGLTVSAGATSVQALTATSVSTAALTSTGSTSVGAVTASGAIGSVGLTSSGGLTVSAGATSVQALTAASISTPSLSVTAGTANVVNLSASGVVYSAGLNSSSGLNVSAGSTALKATSTTTLSATAISASTTLGVTGLSTVAAVTASGLITANAGITIPLASTAAISSAATVGSTLSGPLSANGLTSTGALTVGSGVTSLGGILTSTATGTSSFLGTLSTVALAVTGAATSFFTGNISSPYFTSSGGYYVTTSGSGVGSFVPTGIQTNGTLNVIGSSSLGVLGAGDSTLGATSATSLSASTLGVTGLSTVAAVTASGLITSNAGLKMGPLTTMTLGTIADNSSVYAVAYTTANPTLTMTLVGQTAAVNKTANTAIGNNADTPMITSTIANTGIYTVSFQTRFGGVGTETSLVSWLKLSSPSLTCGLSQISSTTALSIAAGLCLNGTWTGLINASSTLNVMSYMTYSAAPYTATMTGFTVGQYQSYLAVTRIA